jgi:hypothetical protein
MVGSARTGFSLAPKTWGRQFGDQSDLDIAIVSPALFADVEAAFRVWINDYKAGRVGPRSEIELEYWNANASLGDRSIALGFYDSNKLPTFDRYPIAKTIGNTMWLLKSKLESTPSAPRVRRASARIYRDWASLVTQVSLNLKTAARAVRS